ncbi:c-type cytochrome [Aliiroseovarius subalbicans]|uniref:c-type cytochrome n=1 Tax=Aliiroseovarius subalbicans TaxID=2925840 RepID=UPI001F5684CE|nr:c-type cytochrome [Aliiroseovarius subalbicans]MCI2398121.1 c-type cytochrome [Aliiroseovarius subalbicans]
MEKIRKTLVAGLVAATTASTASANEFGDAEAGLKIFNECKACHSVGTGAKNRVGPQLNGIFGRRAGAVDGFKYSKGLARMGKDGLLWDFDKLDRYVQNPKAFASDTRMNYKGLKDEAKRADLLAFLRQYSDNPQNIPEAAPTITGTDHSVDPTILAIQGDPEYGEYLSSECTTCHQLTGDNDGIPGIIGWPAEDFVIAMHAYKDKFRPHPVMQMMSARLSNDEIAALAAYFEAVE